MLNALLNPSVLYPFKYDTSIVQPYLSAVQSIKDCRLSLYTDVAIKSHTPVHVVLQQTTYDRAIFRVQGDYWNSTQYVIWQNGTFSGKNIDTANSFLILSQDKLMPCAGGSMQLLPQCILLTQPGANLVFYSGQSHAKAGIYANTRKKIVNQQTVLRGGYNCQISTQGQSVTITAMQGLGKGKAYGLQQWSQFAPPAQPENGTQQAIQQMSGVRSINGQTNTINIATGASLLSEFQTSSADGQTTLTVVLGVQQE